MPVTFQEPSYEEDTQRRFEADPQVSIWSEIGSGDSDVPRQEYDLPPLPPPNAESEQPAPAAEELHREAASGDEGILQDGRLPKVRTKTKKQLPIPQRTWLRISSTGEITTIGAYKYKIIHKLGVQARDLRLLETQVHTFTPPAVLAREKAIVVSLESVRCIITLDYVLVVNHEDERAVPLIEDLKSKLANPALGTRGYPGFSRLADMTRKLQQGLAGQTSLELPFELKALEICFDKVVTELEGAASELEREALPALDGLTKKIQMSDLEAVRRVKNRLVRLKTRVESIHEVLEKFLDDDEDMHRLNLTAEELSRRASEEEHEGRRAAVAVAAAGAGARQPLPRGRAPGSAGGGPPGSGLPPQRPQSRPLKSSLVGALLPPGVGGPTAGGPARLGGLPRSWSSGGLEEAGRLARLSTSDSDTSTRPKHQKTPFAKSGLLGGPKSSSSSSSSSGSSFNSQDDAEVAEVEMLLEAYDMHLEHTLNRLQTLDEYIKDTEDLVNTGLDQKRNELITADLLLTSNIVALGLITTLAGIFSMNIVPAWLQVEENAFNMIAIASSCGAYLLFGIFILWAWKENMLVF